MIKAVLWDVDGTLLNFQKSEEHGIRACLHEIGFDGFDEPMRLRYEAINRRHWEALERGELTKQEVLLGRFRVFFEQEGITCADIQKFNASYQKKLGEVFFENENAVSLCKKLQGRVKQYVVTNGTVEAQRNKLKYSGLGELMDGIFISDEIGVEKPGIGFFEHAFSVINRDFSVPLRLDEMLIVGDSLTSDMKGGNNAGILCCWYNPAEKENHSEVHLDYTIVKLDEVEQILKQRQALEVIERLKQEYPDADCTLEYDEAWKLLVSVRLAAQCTDARVNVVVEELYKVFPDVNALAEAEPEEIEAIVHPCGLGKSKARDISACMRILRDKYQGKVPNDFEALLALPGVGRKSANLIMGDVFHKPAIVTDTHCIRLTNRIGLIDQEKDPKKVEMALWKLIPPEEGNQFCHRLVNHGREVCTARTKPYCDKCCLEDICRKAGV